MENIRENKKVAEFLKENEQIVLKFVAKMQNRLNKRDITIDDIEIMGLKAIAAIKNNMSRITETVLSEESKKN